MTDVGLLFLALQGFMSVLCRHVLGWVEGVWNPDRMYSKMVAVTLRLLLIAGTNFSMVYLVYLASNNINNKTLYNITDQAMAGKLNFFFTDLKIT